MEQIIRKINFTKKLKNYNKDIVYLLDEYTDNCGLFFHNDKILFAEKARFGIPPTKIETVSLTLFTKLNITSLKANQKFSNGPYNVIYYNGSMEDTNFEHFIRLCTIYAKNSDKSFAEFFYSLISIFQLPSDSKTLDTIGLFGELLFIKEFYEKYSINLSAYWHLDGNNSNYDFQLKSLNLEVKTTVIEKNTFHIKHSQIFNNKNNYLILIRLSKSKYKLKDLIEYFYQSIPFSTNYEFQLRLYEALAKLTDNQLDKAFESLDYFIFHCNDLNTISDIPDEINNVSYEYTFDLSKAKSLNDLNDILINSHSA